MCTGSLDPSDDYVMRPSTEDRHVQRVQHELCAHVVGHRPTDDAPAEDVEHDGEVQKAGPRWYVGDVGNPKLVRGVGNEPALDQIGRRSCVAIAARRDNALSPRSPWILRSRIKRATRCPREFLRRSAQHGCGGDRTSSAIGDRSPRFDRREERQHAAQMAGAAPRIEPALRDLEQPAQRADGDNRPDTLSRIRSFFGIRGLPGEPGRGF